MDKKRETGFEDKNGRMIREGDIFRWTLPKGFVNENVEYDSLLSTIDYLFDLPHGEISEDTTTTSKVVWENGQWELHGVGEDEGWVTVLNGIVARNEYGEVVNG